MYLCSCVVWVGRDMPIPLDVTFQCSIPHVGVTNVRQAGEGVDLQQKH